MKLVIDTNIFIAAIIKDSITRRLIVERKLTLLFPELIFEEIRKNEDEILAKSKLNKSKYIELISVLLRYVYIVPNEALNKYKEEAVKIAKSIDIDDTLFFATALTYKAPIWSNEKRLKKQNEVRVYSTKDLINLLNKN